jgi:hypothetical protein
MHAYTQRERRDRKRESIIELPISINMVKNKTETEEKKTKKVTSQPHLALFAGFLWFLSLNGPKT